MSKKKLQLHTGSEFIAGTNPLLDRKKTPKKLFLYCPGVVFIVVINNMNIAYIYMGVYSYKCKYI